MISGLSPEPREIPPTRESPAPMEEPVVTPAATGPRKSHHGAARPCCSCDDVTRNEHAEVLNGVSTDPRKHHHPTTTTTMYMSHWCEFLALFLELKPWPDLLAAFQQRSPLDQLKAETICRIVQLLKEVDRWDHALEMASDSTLGKAKEPVEGAPLLGTLPQISDTTTATPISNAEWEGLVGWSTASVEPLQLLEQEFQIYALKKMMLLQAGNVEEHGSSSGGGGGGGGNA